MITWGELKKRLEAEGIRDSDVIAQIEITEGFTDELDRAEVYFDHDKDGNRRMYMRFIDE